MKQERLDIYGSDFPRGFTSVTEAVRVARENLTGLLPQSHIPRAAKTGEHLIRVRVDPNCVQHERGDILLSLDIASKAYPELRGDWQIVQARPKWTKNYDGNVIGWYRYLLVRAANPDDAAKVREISNAAFRSAMDRMMSS